MGKTTGQDSEAEEEVRLTSESRKRAEITPLVFLDKSQALRAASTPESAPQRGFSEGEDWLKGPEGYDLSPAQSLSHF